MSDEIIDTEWSELAIDDGTVISSYNEYDIVIGGDEADEITTTPTSINYSPSINKAKNITLDVPPNSALEDLTYLGEDLELYIDGQYAFGGEIYEIETQQREGEDYTIYARPPGKKLNGSDFERTINNEIFSDVISNLVDEYNEFDDKHDFLVGTEFESRNNVTDIGGNVLSVQSGSSGTVTFSPVGSDASQITSVYVKAYTESSNDLSLTIQTTGGSTLGSYSIEEAFDKNRYGEWIRFEVDIDSSSEYEFVFELENEALLIDWISVVNEDVYRETEAPDVDVVEENIPFYSRSNDELESNTVTSGDGIRFDSSGRPLTKDISAWETSPVPETIGDDEFVNGLAGNISYDEFETNFSFSINNELNEWGAYARVKAFELFVNRNETHTLGETRYDDSWSGAAEPSTEQVFNEDSSVKITDDADKGFQHVYDTSSAGEDLVLESKAYIPSGSGYIRWIIEAGFGSDDGYAIYIDSDEIRLERVDDGSTTTLDSDSNYSRQTSEWFEWKIRVGALGDGVSIELTDSQNTYSLSSSDDTHQIFEGFSVETNSTHYLDDMLAEDDSTSKSVEIRVEVDGTSVSFGIGSLLDNYREFTWARLFRFDFADDWPETLSGSVDIYVEALPESETGFMISPLVLVEDTFSWDENSDFDNTVHEPEGHLDFPPIYASGEKFNTDVRFSSVISDDNIFQSTVESDVNTTSDIIGSWGPSQVIDVGATGFPSPSNSQNITQEFSYPGVEHTVQYRLSSGGLRNSESPRTGFNEQRLNSYSVDYSINNLGVVFDRNLSDNRLALMNGLAEDSSVLFRWEGNKANIFHRGQESTNIDLKSENINSSVSIEDVYSSCEVIGLHNVRSGVIESSEAPDFVDAHKVIRTEDIETEVDAKNRARRFLENHGSVQYKGDISTLPTFAPLGSQMSGHLFNHGQDMIIQNVRYSKRGTTISLGYSKNIANELIAINDDTQGTKTRTTSKGMTVPVGEDQI